MRPCLLAVALVLALPGRSVGQTAAPDSALGELAERIKDQSRIRVFLQGGQPEPLTLLGPRLVGRTVRFERYAPQAWTLDTATGPHAIPLMEISHIQIRRGAWGKGAIVGFFAGALAIGAVNLAGKYQIDRGETLWFELLFGTAGAAIGAPVGGICFSEWHTVY